MSLRENIELEVDADQINLKSFDVKKELHPKFWIDNKLNPKVRIRLMDVADDFIEYIDLPFVEPKDMVIVGSIVGYQYSKYSDIDLHIIYDFNEISNKVSFVREYLDAKKNEWNNTRKIKIYGHDVEIYCEDLNEPSTSNGRYSIENNYWIQKPVHNAPIGSKKNYIKEKSAKYITLIDDYEELFNHEKDCQDCMINLFDKVNKLWSILKGMRKEGIKKYGENATENYIFKVIRRSGRLETLYDLKNKLYVFNKSLR